MAGITGYDSAAAEVALIDRGHHSNHAPGGFLVGVVVSILVPVAAALFDVAMRAVLPARCGEETHGGHEFAYGYPFEHSDVLERLLRQEGFRLRRILSARACCAAGDNRCP